MNKRHTGFTLIELLVVIAIIALLLAILMPGLQMAKKKAQALVCRTNLKQWGLAVALYAQNNNDSFPDAVGLWVLPLEQYLGSGKTAEVRLCPTTKVGHSDPFFKAWTTPVPGSNEDFASSYGINNYIYNPPSGVPNLWGRSTSENWRKMSNIHSGMNVPVFLECHRWGGGTMQGDVPMPTRPQTYSQLKSYSLGNNQINRYNLNRHQFYTNVVYVDGSAGKVSLRGLWGLKWFKSYNPAKAISDIESGAGWPEWMKK